MKTTINVRAIARKSLRMYFAPLVGAYRAVALELKTGASTTARVRKIESKRRTMLMLSKRR